MGFLKKIRSSVFDPDFYSKIKHQSFSSVLIYFSLLTLILTTINTLILSPALGITIPGEIRNFVNQSVTSFPPDLEVKIDEGQVSTNTDEPFFVPLPESIKESDYSGINNLLVIDTQTPYSSTQFEQYKTMFWLTKDSLFYQSREYDNRSVDLKDFENITIDKPFVRNLAETASPWLNFVGPVLILLTFIGLFLLAVFNLTYFLFLAVLIFFLSAIFKWGLNYQASYKTAVFASTLPFIVDLVLFNTGAFTGFFGFPFLFTLTALCITTINLQNFKEKS